MPAHYQVGQQAAAIISDVVDDSGNPVTGETLTGWCLDRLGNTYALSSSNPSANTYRILSPTFTVDGRWMWHVTGTTPNMAYGGEWIVDYNPAAAIVAPYDVEDGGEL